MKVGAKSDAKSCSASSSTQAEGNAMSSYKKDNRARQSGWSAPNKQHESGKPDQSYICNRCNIKGHWASTCEFRDTKCPACGRFGISIPAFCTKLWDTKPNKGVAMSCKAYANKEAAAIARSHAFTAEHNAKVEQY